MRRRVEGSRSQSYKVTRIFAVLKETKQKCRSKSKSGAVERIEEVGARTGRMEPVQSWWE